MPDQLLERHVFNFSPTENGGESLLLTTEIFANGDPGGIYVNQELTLHSYGNSASFNLSGIVLTPEVLRRLANELDLVFVKAKSRAA